MNKINNFHPPPQAENFLGTHDKKVSDYFQTWRRRFEKWNYQCLDRPLVVLRLKLQGDLIPRSHFFIKQAKVRAQLCLILNLYPSPVRPFSQRGAVTFSIALVSMVFRAERKKSCHQKKKKRERERKLKKDFVFKKSLLLFKKIF